MEAIGKHIEVTGSLREVIKHFYCIRTPDNFAPTDQHLSPSLEMMLVFNFGLPVKVSFADSAIGQECIKKVAIIGPLRQMLNERFAKFAASL